MKRDITVIADREASNMVSVWREYLCLRAGSTKRYQAFIGGYQPIDEANKYYNEDIEDYELPERIDDIEVAGIEDGWIVGGELDYYDDEDQIEFDVINDDALLRWLSKQRWMDALSDLNDAISRPASAR